MRAIHSWLLLLALSIVPTLSAAALTVPDRPIGRVSDYAGLLSEGDRQALEAKLKAFEDSTSTQIAVAIFPSLEGESLEEFSIRLADRWKIGQKGKDNGAIFLAFLQDRKMRIEVGRGLEGTLTDAISSRIIRNEVAPQFREGRYADGLNAGVNAIMAATRGEYRAERSDRGKGGGIRPLIIALFAMVFLFGIGQISRRQNQRRYVSGGSRGWRSGSTGPWWGGGGGFGGGGGGGSGFSGGGGGFSGGGASGSW